MTYHEVWASEDQSIPREGLLTQAQGDSFKRVAYGPCKRDVAIDHAKNHIRFGAKSAVRVFAGKKVGKLVYEAVATPDRGR